MKCMVCNKERETYNLRIEISGPIAGNKLDHYTEVCPECGFMQLKGAGTEHIKCLSRGFPEIKNTGLTSMKFAERLLNEEDTAVIPGVAFGKDDNIRLSYATSMQEIEKGMNRIEQFCNKL